MFILYTVSPQIVWVSPTQVMALIPPGTALLGLGGTLAPLPLRVGVAAPHRSMHMRDFVLAPMLAVAPDWRHPVIGLTVRQMHARLRNG